MNLAPPGTEGSASGVRTAAKQVGMAVGVALGAAAFFGIAQSTMQDLVTQSGGDWAAASQVLAELRSTTTTDQEIAEQYALPIEDVTEYNREWLEAQLAGYRAQGLLGGFVALAAAALFATHRRGLHKREPETAAVDGDPAGT